MIVVLPMCTVSLFSKGAKAHFDDAIIVIATAYKCDNLRIVLINFLSNFKLYNNLKGIQGETWQQRFYRLVFDTGAIFLRAHHLLNDFQQIGADAHHRRPQSATSKRQRQTNVGANRVHFEHITVEHNDQFNVRGDDENDK